MFEDWYAILNITQDATDSQIQNAYRKLAKKFHPDKNKSSEAVIMFEKISIAQKTLLDEAKRKLFDAEIKSKNEKKRKEEQMDNTRKKMKEDLQQREQQFKKRKEQEEATKRNFEKDNEKYREEFLRELKKGNNSATTSNSRSNVNSENIKFNDDNNDNDDGRIKNLVLKLKWKSKLGYGKDFLLDIFSSYGTVDSITMIDGKSSSTKCLALLSFQLHSTILQVLNNKEEIYKKYKIKIDDYSLKQNDTKKYFNRSTTSSDNNNNNSNQDKQQQQQKIEEIIKNTIPDSYQDFTSNLVEEEDDILAQMKNHKLQKTKS
eukprot:gene7386-9073_t